MMNKILLVDDEIEITEINKRYLEQGGYDIDIANDGKEALEKYKRNKYSDCWQNDQNINEHIDVLVVFQKK